MLLLADALRAAEGRRRTANQHALAVMADNLSSTQQAVLKVGLTPQAPHGTRSSSETERDTQKPRSYFIRGVAPAAP